MLVSSWSYSVRLPTEPNHFPSFVVARTDCWSGRYSRRICSLGGLLVSAPPRAGSTSTVVRTAATAASMMT